MKKALSMFLLFIFCSPSILAANHVKVFLLGGQSNMDGRAPLSDLPTSPVNLQQPQTNVMFYHDHAGATVPANVWTTLAPGSGVAPGGSSDRFGPEVTFGQDIAEAFSGETIALIKHAQGGTKLATDWFPNPAGSEYSTFNDTVAAALASLSAAEYTYDIAGMIWMQGESDSTVAYANAYETNLTNLIANIRSRYGADIRFVAGETWRNEGDSSHPGTLGDIVSAAQQAAADNDPNVGFVSTRDLTWQDNYHLDAAGQMTLGSRFASEMVQLLSQSPTSANTPLVAAHWSFDTDFRDVSENGANGTLVDVDTVGNSGITTATGEFRFGGGALNLSGDPDYVSFSTKTLIADLDGYAIAFWAKNRSAVYAQDGMVIGDITDTLNFIWIDSKYGGLRIRSNSSTYTADFGVGEDNNWHHYVIVVEDADDDGFVDDVSLYFDGSYFDTQLDKAGTDFDISAIGHAYSNSSYDYDFNGQIDEVWVFNASIGEDFVTSLYTANRTIVDAGSNYITWLDNLSQSLTGTVNSAFSINVDPDTGVDWSIIGYPGTGEPVPAAGVVNTTTDPASPTAIFITDTTGDYTIRLTVTNTAGQFDADTLTVRVAQDACSAAQLVPGFIHDNDDINGNCIIDLPDLAAFAAKWMEDNSLTESEPY